MIKRRQTKIMGILNVTPNSFYDGGLYLDPKKAIEKGVELAKQGADIIDIGGESTKPYTEQVNEKEELNRVIPVIRELKKLVNIPLSVDTKKLRVAEQAIKEGVSFINDISGFNDPKIMELAAKTGVKICIMHMQKTPETMQIDPQYPEGVIPHLLKFFIERIQAVSEAGVLKKNIFLDPGIGFGKTVENNFEILHNIERLKAMGFPILLGLSRKSFMSKTIGKKASELLPATLAMNTLAIWKGVDMIRVHDVLEHKDALEMIQKFKNEKTK